MRNILFLIVMLVSMCLPQLTLADSGKKGDIYAFSAGVSVVVDNNVDVTYTGKTWKENGNNKYEYIARISQAPIYNDDGSLVDCSWHGSEDAYIIINNVFSAQVIGAYITTTYQGQSMSWNPVVLVDSKEYVAKGSPKVLSADPINENYNNNTLEWDYGVCVRRVRVIEGLIQETWIFDKDPKGTVWIKDNAQKSAGFTWAIAPYAYDADGNAITINQYKQVMASDMAKAVYPVTIDPTEVYVTSASDGYAHAVDPVAYATAWIQVNADDVSSGGAVSYFGQLKSGGSYNIYRAYLYFDTSAIPDSASITAANVSIYGSGDLTTTDFNMTITNGQPTYPHDPLVVGDYDKTNYSGIGGSLNTSSFITTGYTNISLNASGISWISLVGTTKLTLRSQKDIDGTAPTGSEYLEFSAYERGAGYRPYLEVTYSSSGVPTVTTNPATYVTKTTAQLNGYVNADGGEADTVSFNYQPWYSDGWLDCIEFTINASYVDANLTNFPVLVTGTQLNTTDPDFWTTVDVNGSDILFTASDGITKLNRELVSIDTTNESMECYVNVTAVDDTNNTKFYMYYNSANISLYNESNSVQTWDANYIAVWHMGDLNTSAISDSTVNAQTGIKKDVDEPLAVNGNFGGDKAQQFDATDDYINISHNTNQLLTTGGTIESIIYANSYNESGGYIVDKSTGTTAQNGYKFNIRYHANNQWAGTINAGTATYGATNSVVYSTWRSAGITWNSTGWMQPYSQGATTGTLTLSANPAGITTTNVLCIGQRSTATDRTFDGNISEVRISNVSRSTAWVNATYTTLMLPTSFAPVTDVFTTTATQSKNTGDSWYNSVSGLTANQLYGYKAEAANSYGTSWGAWVFLNTSVTLGVPTNVSCSANSNSVTLSWVKGGNSSYTYIRYKTGGYPTSATDGNAVANQSGVNLIHTGLSSGTSYYYRLWGEDGGILSTTNVTTMCTTTAGSSVATPAPLPTVNFSGGTTTPNGSALTNNPLYTLGNQEAAAISVPQGTWWMLVGLGILIVTGLFIYTRSRNLLLSLGAMIIAGVIMANMGMFPIWILWVFGLSGIGMSWKELR